MDKPEKKKRCEFYERYLNETHIYATENELAERRETEINEEWEKWVELVATDFPECEGA
jgi:hypothetical protein